MTDVQKTVRKGLTNAGSTPWCDPALQQRLQVISHLLVYSPEKGSHFFFEMCVMTLHCGGNRAHAELWREQSELKQEVALWGLCSRQPANKCGVCFNSLFQIRLTPPVVCSQAVLFFCLFFFARVKKKPWWDYSPGNVRAGGATGLSDVGEEGDLLQRIHFPPSRPRLCLQSLGPLPFARAFAVFQRHVSGTDAWNCEIANDIFLA